MFQKDLSIVEKLVTDVAKQTLVMMALDMSGASNMINNGRCLNSRFRPAQAGPGWPSSAQAIFALF